MKVLLIVYDLKNCMLCNKYKEKNMKLCILKKKLTGSFLKFIVYIII